MRESYFQDKFPDGFKSIQTRCREELAEVRERLEEIQQNAIETNPEYVRHERQFPGRIAKFMDQAVGHLDEAERMIAAMGPSPQQKALRIAFNQTLQLADHCVRQALWDSSIQRDILRQKGTRKPRRPEINEWIERQLRRQPDAKSPELWNRAPEWITDQDHHDVAIKYEAFARRVTNTRDRLGLKRKKTTSSN